MSLFIPPEGWTEHLLPPSRAVDLLPRIALTAEEIDRVRAGQAIPRQAPATQSPEIAALDSAGRLVAILVPRGPGLLGPVRNLPLED